MIRKIIFWVLAVIIILAIGVYLWLGQIVKTGVERFVPPIVGVPVTVEEVNISLFRGHFEVKGLNVANPKGFGTQSAFALGTVNVDVDMKSLLSNTIIIRNVLIEKPMASIEINQNGMNLDKVNQNIQKYLNTGASAKTVPTKTGIQKKSERKLIIRNLDFKDGKLYVGAFGQGQTIPLPNINQKNIGEKSNKTIGQTIAEVINIFSSEAVQQYAKSGLQAGKQIIQDTGKQVEDTVKGLKDLF